MERSAQDGGRTAAACQIHLRDHRSAPGAADDHLPLSAFRSSSDSDPVDRRAAEADLRDRKSGDQRRRDQRDCAGGRRRNARCAVTARPDDRLFLAGGWLDHHRRTGAVALRSDRPCRSGCVAGGDAPESARRSGFHHRPVVEEGEKSGDAVRRSLKRGARGTALYDSARPGRTAR